MSTSSSARIHSVKRVSLILSEEPHCKPVVANTLNRLASRHNLGERKNPDKKGPRFFSDSDICAFAKILQGKVGRPRKVAVTA